MYMHTCIITRRPAAQLGAEIEVVLDWLGEIDTIPLSLATSFTLRPPQLRNQPFSSSFSSFRRSLSRLLWF